jgi:ATP-dependent DNA helicase PIF1
MTQPEAIAIMLSGANVFLTGEPGAGKTYTLNKFIDAAEAKRKSVAITASTGIAASHIGGVTIHSWSGLGIAEELTEADLIRLSNNGRLVKRYRKTQVLVIDEVSMLHGARLDMVNAVAKKLRGSDLPFGGMQVILVGDLFQLPPVTRGSNVFDFVHLSNSWQELGLKVCYITEQHRQEGDDMLLALLQAMRSNSITPEHLQMLKHREGVGGDNMTRLFSHNVDVDVINRAKLDALPGKIRSFRMRVSGDPRKSATLMKNVLAPETLELKVGAEVMFVANNFEIGFVNGSRGRVLGFHKKTKNPVVQMETGRKIQVEEHAWIMKEDDVEVARVEQHPLRLAWAITIHKSQGMSLDSAIVDLSKAFTPGMGYVALSRVRSLKGLYLTGINETALTMHEEIYELDGYLREASK